ncbi:hypothetical protein L6452_03197 [Arctium lappa]|uniref:Uncharacterized protein n=1 Tax=Arctium lappa TaxID=4217 RepID=A0ACB9FMJ9_ARCLA|nr:hypothetical protein L6452_03197 [Arctium lappa]
MAAEDMWYVVVAVEQKPSLYHYSREYVRGRQNTTSSYTCFWFFLQKLINFEAKTGLIDIPRMIELLRICGGRGYGRCSEEGSLGLQFTRTRLSVVLAQIVGRSVGVGGNSCVDWS